MRRAYVVAQPSRKLFRGFQRKRGRQIFLDNRQLDSRRITKMSLENLLVGERLASEVLLLVRTGMFAALNDEI
jgi:hypothetical protein